MNIMSRKSQIWSLDIIIASVIFIIAIVVFLAIYYSGSSGLTHEQLLRESNKINELISGSGQGSASLAFIIGPNIDIDQTGRVQEYSYEELKSEMGVRANFCIYLEDMDGRVINLSEFTDETLNEIGIGHNGTRFVNSTGHEIAICSTR